MNQFLRYPPSGWNSFDSFGGYLHETAAMEQLDAFERLLKPHGYEYFVVDIGWYGEYEFKPGTNLPSPKTKHAADINMDGYGRPLPSKCYFPNGLRPIIDAVHARGLKFGIHMMRGIPRQAVEKKLPVLGTEATADQIANTGSTCKWCHYNYGVNMGHPAGQAYYDSMVALLAEWGVDFIKYDDITGFPEEVEAVATAIERCGRPIVLSLSPGGDSRPEVASAYRRSDMLRITKDIWDDQDSIRRSFNAWLFWSEYAQPGFWIDLDMIPFGRLQTMSPEPDESDTPEGVNPLLCGKGWSRDCELSLNHKRSFITQRAMACSPLFAGGDLTTLPEEDLKLLTDPRMLACNRNGMCGKLIYMVGDAQVFQASNRTVRGAGWLAVFNRNPAHGDETIQLTHNALRLSPKTRLHDVWEDRSLGTLGEAPVLTISSDAAVFIEYEGARD